MESETSLASGAAPWMVSPVLSSVGRPAMMPATWVPWPPSERVSVSTLVRDVEHLAGRLERVAQHLLVADDGAGAVRLLEVGVGRVDAGVDQADADAGSAEGVAVGAGEGLVRLGAAGGLVGLGAEELDRLVALEVGHARLEAGGRDLGLGGAGDDHADLVEAAGLGHAGGGDGTVGGGEGAAVHEHGGLLAAGEAGQLAGQEVLDGREHRRGLRGALDCRDECCCSDQSCGEEAHRTAHVEPPEKECE